MTLSPVGLFWPRPRLIVLLLCVGIGAASLLHRAPPPRPAVEDVRCFHYRVARAAFLRESEQGRPSCRIVPAMVGSRPVGFRVYAIRPDSLFARLGIHNGDLVERVNGVAITSPDRAIEIYSKLHQAQHIEVYVTRHDVPVRLHYDVVD